MKVGQAEKFVKAKEDSLFTRSKEDDELSPEQLANQARLRKVAQVRRVGCCFDFVLISR